MPRKRCGSVGPKDMGLHTIDLPDDTRVIRRTMTQSVLSIKAARPRKAGRVS